MPYNLMIPGWLPESELKVIEQIALTVPKNGHVVEIGPFCGRSSWCWAKTVDPSVTVTCIDIWDTVAHPYYPPARIGLRGDSTAINDFGAADRVEEAQGTLENFQRYTRDCPNVRAIRGASPQDFKGWNDRVDVVYLDGLHHNPGFIADLEFWFTKLKDGAIICGDDCARSHPDVLWSVHDFAKAKNLPFFVLGRTWLIPRPPHKNIVASLFPSPLETVRIR
jgi:precorrin-6B methylase 2